VAPYTSDMMEQSFQHDLFAWRESKARELFGDINFFTPNVFLHMDILLRIVDLAHAHRLCSVDDLKNQTSWCFADEYGGDIISFVSKYFPATAHHPRADATPFTSMPLHSRVGATNSTVPYTGSTVPTPAKPRAPPRCSDCGVVGHRSASISFVYSHSNRSRCLFREQQQLWD
jgi:hypothetical protein